MRVRQANRCWEVGLISTRIAAGGLQEVLQIQNLGNPGQALFILPLNDTAGQE